MEILSGSIILRPWLPDDAGRLASIANNRNISDNLRDGFPYPYTHEDAVNWLKNIIPENDPPRFFAIIYDGKLAGSIGLVLKSDIYRKNIEVGYFLAENFWGKGIMTTAIRAAVSYAFKTFDIVRVYAEPFADNPGSRKALEKAGFRLEAVLHRNVIKNGVIKDSCIYAMLKEEFTDN